MASAKKAATKVVAKGKGEKAPRIKVYDHSIGQEVDMRTAAYERLKNQRIQRGGKTFLRYTVGKGLKEAQATAVSDPSKED